MAKQIEVLPPDDSFFNKVAKKCANYTGPVTYDNETGEILYLRINNLEKRL